MSLLLCFLSLYLCYWSVLQCAVVVHFSAVPSRVVDTTLPGGSSGSSEPIPLMFKCVPAASFLVLSVVLPFLVQLHDSLQVPLIFFSFSSQSPSSVLTCLTELASCTYTISALVLEDFGDSHGNHLW